MRKIPDQDILGPVDGAIYRMMFPIPTPGQTIPYATPDVTLEELDSAWDQAIDDAQTAARNAIPGDKH